MSTLKATTELEKAKKLYLKLKNNENSVLFGKDNLMNNLVKQLERSNNKKAKRTMNL